MKLNYLQELNLRRKTNKFDIIYESIMQGIRRI